jgi:uncharacterized protein (DUF433 family)
MESRVRIDPRIYHGKPVIEGTRVPVSVLLGSLAGRMSIDEVAAEYGVTTDDICAALRFAGTAVDGPNASKKYLTNGHA